MVNGINVFGLLIDILLMEGFYLVSIRIVFEDKIECYSFERIKRFEVFFMNKILKLEIIITLE